MSAQIRLERHGAVGVIVADNPPVNAMGRQLLTDLDIVVREVESDPSLRAVVITGTGDKAFLAGADLKEFGELVNGSSAMRDRARWSRGIFERIEALDRPVIAAIQASAVGGGTEVALLCDIVMCDPSAKFGLTEVRLGLIPGAGGTQRLARRVGASRAKEIMYFGRAMSAAEAHRIGLVNTISEPGQVLAESIKAAKRLAALPALALRSIKRAVAEGMALSLSDGLDLEHELFLSTVASADAREGYQAFLDKREPRFTHE